MYPGHFTRNCSYRSENAGTLYHMVYGCQKNPGVSPIDTPNVQHNPDDHWEALHTSRNPEQQLLLV
ncbi:hypothetical protein HPB50_010394 [Hyalomma asiaticum]|uniref:Uncharacterized protein n=1 Tax=Hyalomma asiaticum TaxID=266040 RepID=A0ACB7T6A4_HYAAI|nr:hypothetical protein HPB50_010394 [Hyalomma asiaticum]